MQIDELYVDGKLTIFLIDHFIVGILNELGWLCGKFQESFYFLFFFVTFRCVSEVDVVIEISSRICFYKTLLHVKSSLKN